MTDKINFFPIIKDHISTLKVLGESKISTRDLFSLFGLPIFLSVFISYLICFDISGTRSSFIALFSIFSAILPSALALIFGVAQRMTQQLCVESRPATSDEKLKISLIAEIESTISFSILISIISLIFLLIDLDVRAYEIVQSLSVLFLFFCLVLTNLMLLKRLHRLLQDEIRTALEYKQD